VPQKDYLSKPLKVLSAGIRNKLKKSRREGKTNGWGGLKNNVPGRAFEGGRSSLLPQPNMIRGRERCAGRGLKREAWKGFDLLKPSATVLVGALSLSQARRPFEV